MTIQQAEGYFVAVKFSNQLTAGVQSVLSLQCLASKIGEVAVVEPMLIGTNYGFNVYRTQQLRTIRFGDLHDLVKWNHYTTSLHYSPLVSVENFNKTLCTNKLQDLILVEYNCKHGSNRALNNGIAFGQKYGLNLVKHICFDFRQTMNFTHFKKCLFSGYKPNEVVVLFSRYGGIYKVGPEVQHQRNQVYISGTECQAGSNDLVFNGLYPSASVMSDAEQYIYEYMNGTQNYISVMVRIEKSLIHSNYYSREKAVIGAMKCVQNVITQWKRAQQHYRIYHTFLTTDVGRFGSSSLRSRMNESALMEAAEYLFSVIHGGTLNVTEWEQSFTTVGMGQTQSPAYIGMMQKVISAKGSVLITAGGNSTFHDNTQALHQQLHHNPHLIRLGYDCS